MGTEQSRKTALIFGLGYVGSRFLARLREDGWNVSAVIREGTQISRTHSLGAQPILANDVTHLIRTMNTADIVLITAPPTQEGCPALASMRPALSSGARPRWIGYLSSTSVYGDQQCRIADETAELKATSPEGQRRIEAEKAWQVFTQGEHLPLTIFRLAAIYGPERSAIDRVQAGTARRIIKPGHVLSRVHVDDIISLLWLSIQTVGSREIYNASDDEPTPAQDVVAYASMLLNLPAPLEERIDDVELSPTARRFFNECRRISATYAKERLGWKPAYSTYREGLNAIMNNKNS